MPNRCFKLTLSILYVQKAVFIFFIYSVVSCNTKTVDVEGKSQYGISEDFKNYWYSGEAEINVYAIKQSRYSEIRNGTCVRVFATEDFLEGKQVKKEKESTEPFNSVLKNNNLVRFKTGIYDYSLMTSIFTEASKNQTMKVTHSSQDWCGQQFTQLNRESAMFGIRSFSYFEEKSDASVLLPVVLLEDEIWNKIRIDPTSLPIGEIGIIPAMWFCDLMHIQHKLYLAVASFDDDSLSEKTFTITYPDLKRELRVSFDIKFPHLIKSWTDTYDDWGRINSSNGVLINTIKTDYWNRNQVSDSLLRVMLMGESTDY